MATEQIAGLTVAAELRAFVRDEALPGTGIAEDDFWSGLAGIVADLGPVRRELLATRDRLQAALDDYHRQHPGAQTDQAAYQAFLREIGYLVPEPADVAVTTANVDPEISALPGPQLVVPAPQRPLRHSTPPTRAGARCTTPSTAPTSSRRPTGCSPRARAYNPRRGAAVVERAAGVPRRAPAAGRRQRTMTAAAYHGSKGRRVGGRAARYGRVAPQGPGAVRRLPGGSRPRRPRSCCKHHGLHVEIVIDRAGPIGATDPAGRAGRRPGARLTTIMDCEDSVAAVDAEDKVGVYRNWLGLMKGDARRGGRPRAASTFTAQAQPDRIQPRRTAAS
jgi:malate synthase